MSQNLNQRRETSGQEQIVHGQYGSPGLNYSLVTAHPATSKDYNAAHAFLNITIGRARNGLERYYDSSNASVSTFKIQDAHHILHLT